MLYQRITGEESEPFGEAGPSLIAAQTRHCLKTLAEILKDEGSSLDRVLGQTGTSLENALEAYLYATSPT